MSGRNQLIKVPLMAEDLRVLQDVERVTPAPAFISVRRGSQMSVRLVERDGSERSVSLRTKLRWTESLVPNFVSALINPAIAVSGLLVDFATGAAWEADPLEGAPLPSPLRTIILLPPAARTESHSEALTRALVGVVRSRYPSAGLVTRKDEPALFLEHGLTHHQAAPAHRVDAAAAALSASHFLEFRGESEIELVDIFTGRLVDRWSWRPDSLVAPELMSRPLAWLGEQILDAAPNTIGISSRSGTLDNLAAAAGGSPISGVRVRRTSSLGLLGTNLSVSIGSARPRGSLPNWGLDARLVPSLGFSSSEIEVSSHSLDSTVNGNEFRRTWTLTTIGLNAFGEVGFHTPGGYLFVGIGPALTAGLISGSRSAGRASVAFEFETGWSFYLSSRLHIRLFSGIRGIPEEFVRFMVETDRPLADGYEFKLSELASGVVLEYVWPETRDRLRSGAEALFSRTGSQACSFSKCRSH